jgi:hypothetical protein
MTGMVASARRVRCCFRCALTCITQAVSMGTQVVQQSTCSCTGPATPAEATSSDLKLDIVRSLSPISSHEHLLELLAQGGHAPPQDALVHLLLLLAHALALAARLPLQVGPHSAQARQLVAALGQLHLCVDAEAVL